MLSRLNTFNRPAKMSIPIAEVSNIHTSPYLLFPVYSMWIFLEQWTINKMKYVTENNMSWLTRWSNFWASFFSFNLNFTSSSVFTSTGWIDSCFVGTTGEPCSAGLLFSSLVVGWVDFTEDRLPTLKQRLKLLISLQEWRLCSKHQHDYYIYKTTSQLRYI